MAEQENDDNDTGNDYDAEEPVEADGLDPEIDFKATEDALFPQQKPVEKPASNENFQKVTDTMIKVNDTVAGAVDAAADKVAQGTDHVVETGRSMAATISGTGGKVQE